jgi:hypothetical protein
MDMMRIQICALTSTVQPSLTNHDQIQTIILLSQQTQLSMMNQLLTTINHYREQVLSGINLNKTLLMEHIFIALMENGA